MATKNIDGTNYTADNTGSIYKETKDGNVFFGKLNGRKLEQAVEAINEAQYERELKENHPGH